MAVRTDIWVDFDSSPRIVWVRAPSTSVLIQDLVDTIRDLESEVTNMSYDSLLRAAGKDQLGPVEYVGITATLQNAVIGFEARSGPAYVQCKVSGGNLVAVDTSNVPISAIYPTAFTQVNYEASTSPTLVTSSTSGVGTPEEVANAVWNGLLAAHVVSGSFGEWATLTNTTLDALTTSQIAIIDLIQTITKFHKNRTRVDKVAKTLTVYDDDTLTPIRVFNLRDFDGLPTITEVAERSPV